jgi:hypothetical protein
MITVLDYFSGHFTEEGNEVIRRAVSPNATDATYFQEWTQYVVNAGSYGY